MSTVPTDLEAIVLRCLAKDRAQRFANADELEANLAACADAGAWSVQQAKAWWSTQAERITLWREAHAAGTKTGLDFQQTLAVDGANRTAPGRAIAS